MIYNLIHICLFLILINSLISSLMFDLPKVTLNFENIVQTPELMSILWLLESLINTRSYKTTTSWDMTSVRFVVWLHWLLWHFGFGLSENLNIARGTLDPWAILAGIIFLTETFKFGH